MIVVDLVANQLSLDCLMHLLVEVVEAIHLDLAVAVVETTTAMVMAAAMVAVVVMDLMVELLTEESS